MVLCGAKTKSGKPCKRSVISGSCHIHIKTTKTKKVENVKVLENLHKFILQAIDDLILLQKAERQFCRDYASKETLKQINKLSIQLHRIVHGCEKPKVPGIRSLLSGNTFVSIQDIDLLRKKFLRVHSEVLSLMLKHCKFGNQFLNVYQLKFSFKGAEKVCENIPTELKHWVKDITESQWVDKHILCLGLHNGQHVNLPVGYILPEKFEVIKNVEDGKFYGIARKRTTDECGGIVCKILQAIQAGGKYLNDIINTLLTALYYLLRLLSNGVIKFTPYILNIILRYWTYIFTVVIVGCFYSNGHLLTIIPHNILRTCVEALRVSINVVKGSFQVPEKYKHILLKTSLFVVDTVSTVVEDVKLLPAPPKQLYLPPPPKQLLLAAPKQLKMIAPPSPTLLDSIPSSPQYDYLYLLPVIGGLALNVINPDIGDIVSDLTSVIIESTAISTAEIIYHELAQIIFPILGVST